MNKLNYVPKLSVYDSFFLLISSIMTTILGFVLPFSILIIFDRILPNQSTSSLYFIFVIVLAAIFFDYKVKGIEESIVSKIANRFEKNITNQLFNAICHANLSHLSRLQTGEYLERLRTIPSLKSFFSGDLITAAINIITCCITLVVISIIDIGAGMTLLIASSFLLMVARYLAIKKVKLLEAKSDIEGLTNSKVIEIVSYPMDIKSRAMEYRVENLMDTMVKQREQQNTEFEQQESRYNLLLNFIQQMSIILVVISCAIAVINLNMSQGVMAAIILLTNRYFSPYQQAMRTLSQWLVNQSYIYRLNEMLELEETDPEKKRALVKGRAAANNYPNIDSISYQQTQNYQFKSSQINIITGPSGCGKSSVLNALVYEQALPDYKIRVNSEVVPNYYVSEYMSDTVKIDKNSHFIEGSIIDNITCFRPQYHKAAYSLCEALAIKKEIDELKQGFFTNINSVNSQPFSRQVHFALLIVRALLSNKHIILIDDIDLVYDEAFSVNLLACLRPRTKAYIFIIASNKIGQADMMINRLKINEVS